MLAIAVFVGNHPRSCGGPLNATLLLCIPILMTLVMLCDSRGYALFPGAHHPSLWRHYRGLWIAPPPKYIHVIVAQLGL
ncbi:hypothetical protein BDQ17DRAFT_1342089, partial [Cyathus striatus]